LLAEEVRMLHDIDTDIGKPVQVADCFKGLGASHHNVWHANKPQRRASSAKQTANL